MRIVVWAAAGATARNSPAMKSTIRNMIGVLQEVGV
jgi:hypothetical protein